MIMMNLWNRQGAEDEQRVSELRTEAPVVRPATQAGRFYESNPQKLSQEVDSFLAHCKCPLNGEKRAVVGLIVPHAGYYFSGNVAASAYRTLPADKPYKRIFLLGPSHHEWFDGASVNSEADYYATPLGNVKVDRETTRRLLAADSVFTYRKEAHNREHCLEVQLPFLQRYFATYSTLPTKEVPPIVPIIISTNDYSKLERIADVLKPYLNEDSDEGGNLFIISSDFSHYPSYADACEADARTGKAVESGDVEQFIEALEVNARSGKRNLVTSACGEFPIMTLLLMLNGQYDVKHLIYQNSGDIQRHLHPRRQRKATAEGDCAEEHQGLVRRQKHQQFPFLNRQFPIVTEMRRLRLPPQTRSTARMHRTLRRRHSPARDCRKDGSCRSLRRSTFPVPASGGTQGH